MLSNRIRHIDDLNSMNGNKSLDRSFMFKFIMTLIPMIFFIVVFPSIRAVSTDFGISDSYVQVIVILNVFLSTMYIIYWYLIVRPVEVHSSYLIEDKYSFSEEELLEVISEIEKALYIYESSPEVTKKEDDFSEVVKYIQIRLDSLPRSREFSNFSTATLTDGVKRKLFGVSLQTLKDGLSKRKAGKIEVDKNKSDEESGKDKSLERMTKLIDIVTTRLKTEIAQLSKRADIYILFGSGITLVGGVVLYYTVQELLSVYKIDGSGSVNSSDFLSVAIRVSVVIFIEVFAFYYLRLYRNIMDNIKYYQNEITNIEMKVLSLHSVEGRNCSESMKVLAAELAKTERNFVIDKNKITVDIERSKLESDVFKSTTDSFVKILKSAKP